MVGVNDCIKVVCYRRPLASVSTRCARDTSGKAAPLWKTQTLVESVETTRFNSRTNNTKHRERSTP